MHEFGIVAELINLTEKALQDENLSGEGITLNLIVGKFSGASPEALETAFEVLKEKSSVLSDSILKIEEPLPTCICSSCHTETKVESVILSCPVCRSSNIHLSGGDELRLDSIDIDDNIAE